jgi:hypothetical protein
LISRLAETELKKTSRVLGSTTGASSIFWLRSTIPYPYFRGLVSEIGFPVAKIPYHQPARPRGVTSNNFYSLYDMAMLGITNHSKVPLRLATMLGFLVSFLSLCVAFCYFIFKLIYWDSFQAGSSRHWKSASSSSARCSFSSSASSASISASIHTQVQKRPHVVESGTNQFLTMKVVILCGGLGTRLREETEFRPKPMVPVGNRPILWHIMKFYAHYGFKEFILCLGYKAEVIKEYFFNYQRHSSDVTLKLGPTPEITYHNQHRGGGLVGDAARHGAEHADGRTRCAARWRTFPTRNFCSPTAMACATSHCRS